LTRSISEKPRAVCNESLAMNRCSNHSIVLRLIRKGKCSSHHLSLLPARCHQGSRSAGSALSAWSGQMMRRAHLQFATRPTRGVWPRLPHHPRRLRMRHAATHVLNASCGMPSVLRVKRPTRDMRDVSVLRAVVERGAATSGLTLREPRSSQVPVTAGCASPCSTSRTRSGRGSASPERGGASP
jgi:hypothetical protein